MPDKYTVEVLVDEVLKHSVCFDQPLEIGRQKVNEPAPYALIPVAEQSPPRLIIAPQHDKDNISRRHLTLVPLGRASLQLFNHSQAALPCPEHEGGYVLAGQDAEVSLPFRVLLPGRTLRVLGTFEDDPHGVQSLAEPTRGPSRVADCSHPSNSFRRLLPAQMRALLEGMPHVLGVLQSAVGAGDVLQRASQAIVQVVGLDSGRTLLRQGTEWEVAALHGLPGPAAWRPSRHVIDRLLQARSTVWQRTDASGEPDSASLRLLDTVVAAPLLDRHEQVIGVLYGERRKDNPLVHSSDHVVEAILVDLLASGVSAGLARLEQEKAALRASTLFEQFFSPDLARSLSADPRLLEGKEATVTVLFADVRSFSTLSEQLGAQLTFRWIHDVLGELSRCVQDEGGVLVDYIGDELLAMWGAPQAQANHASRAVRAGLAMQAALDGIDERWQATLGTSTRIGIGVNTGAAQVGNTGSALKFKYGPLGNTVNVAARVRGLTKYVQCSLLITAATRAALGNDVITRRVALARVHNVKTPVELFEADRAGSSRGALFARSEDALTLLEAGEFTRAAGAAAVLLAEHPGDGPLLLTLARATDALVRRGEEFEPVWVAPGK